MRGARAVHSAEEESLCRFAVSGSNDRTSRDADNSSQFYGGTNGSRCSSKVVTP